MASRQTPTDDQDLGASIPTAATVYAEQKSQLNAVLGRNPNLRPVLYRLLDIQLKSLKDKNPFQLEGTPSFVSLDILDVYRSVKTTPMLKFEGDKVVKALVNVVILEVIPLLKSKGYVTSYDYNRSVLEVNV